MSFRKGCDWHHPFSGRSDCGQQLLLPENVDVIPVHSVHGTDQATISMLQMIKGSWQHQGAATFVLFAESTQMYLETLTLGVVDLLTVEKEKSFL